MRSEGKHCPGPSRSSSCVKLYLCSNPGDSAMERRALRENVFSGFREHCRNSLGLDVRVIDPFESPDPSRWPDESARQKLIKECKTSSAGPFLLALVGPEYGEPELPSQVLVSEFQQLLQQSQQAGVCTDLLERTYLRDENVRPPSCCLLKQASIQPTLAEEKKEDTSVGQEAELKKVFQNAVRLCVLDSLMTPERAKALSRSVVDADLRFALEGCDVQDSVSRCVVYVHRVIKAGEDRGRRQRDTPLQAGTQVDVTDQTGLLSDLCENFLPTFATSSHRLLYTTTINCCQGYTVSRRRSYVESLCQQVSSDLVMLTESRNVTLSRDPFSGESFEQEQLCSTISQFYSIIRPEEEKVRSYLEQSEQQSPLVVKGGPCTGKTVFAANCAQQIKHWLTDCSPVVLTFFCDLSRNPSPKHLLSSLCYQIARRYDCCSPDLDPNICPWRSSDSCNRNPESSTCTTAPDRGVSLHTSAVEPMSSLHELSELLSHHLAQLPSMQHPLVLILDGLDQLENNSGAQVIRHLPSRLPENVKLIITASSNRTSLLQEIKLHSRQGDGKESAGVCVELQPVGRKQCLELLASLLKSSGRKVTSGQQALVNRAVSSCRLPLYVRLLCAHAVLWRSDSDVMSLSLPDGVHSSISTLLDNLEQKHGTSLVARTVSYLSSSKTGLSEAELADLLTCDHDELRCHKSPHFSATIFQVDVERLLLDLKDVLIKRAFADSQVLLWVTRHFKSAVSKRYLCNPEARTRIQSEMADYYNWKLHRGSDRQPFLLSRQINVKTLLELPFLLQQSGRLQELECGLLMSSGFHQALVRAGMLADLVDMLEAREGLNKFVKERFLLASILKSAACFLQRSPLQLRAVMEENLLPYEDIFPALQCYIRDIRMEREQMRTGVGIIMSPSPTSIPSFLFLRDGLKEGHVAGTAGTDFGIVAETLDDGSAWIWKGFGLDLVRLSLSSELREIEFVGVKGYGQFLLLSTKCNKLLLWDVTGPEQLVELKDCLKTELNSSQNGKQLAGFVTYQDKLCIWRRNESIVSVFNVCSQTLTQLQCQGSVTCLARCHDRLYCGQGDGAVLIFDLTTSSLLATYLEMTRSDMLLIIVCDERQSVVCVENTGSVFLWEVAGEKNPPTLVKEHLNPAESPSIVSLEYSEAASCLLVCQTHQVALLDACTCSPLEQFFAPRGRAFTHGILSPDGHFFLASLNGCTSVLVWRVSTGECVLSLETNSQPHTLLKMDSEVVCIGQHGCLTAWLPNMVDTAAAACRMRRAVSRVVVENSGEWFYTTDGSEHVWRWSAAKGLPVASLGHDCPVKKLLLSPNGAHLVSLSEGDLYVWHTETGQNTARIHGSRATDVLITPNGNFGVSISEHSISRVWKMANGGIICNIYQYLSDGQVSPEGTFLLGLHCGDLLAASLWSGSISKRFSCVGTSEEVVAFQTLSTHPDFVMVMAASGAVYTWKLSEETVCWHFQLPDMFCCKPPDFQMTSDGSYALLSTDKESIHILDLLEVRLCSLKADGHVRKAFLDKTGCYIAYVCEEPGVRMLQLTIARLSDGERIGSVPLWKTPSTLAFSEQQSVFVGFEDGSVGVYSVVDALMEQKDFIKEREIFKGRPKICPFDSEPSICFCQAKPNIKWP